jgi:predicted permease
MADRLLQDVRYAVRALARTPLFAIVSILSIAVGVGSTTAIVTLASTLLLRPPPGIGNPERVVSVGRTQDGRGFDNFSYANFADYRAATAFSGLAAVSLEPRPVSLTGPSGAEPVSAGYVSGNFFDVLRARPFLGRFFLPEDDRAPGATAVVVLSHAFWRSRFAADPAVVGRSVVLNGMPFTVVGIAAAHFQGPFVLTNDLWVPMMSATLLGWNADMFTNRAAVWLIAIGRLAPDATIAAAQAELGAIAARLEREYPEVNRGKGVVVTPTSFFPGESRRIVVAFMAMLFAITTLVLVIASTNVAGMLLARAAGRRREIAVRLAIGASRWQLVRQLVTESVLLFAVAGSAGVVLARWMVSGLMSLIPRLPVQLGFDPAMDWRVFAFALAASLVAGLAAGLFPAVQSSRPELVPALKSDAGATGRRQRLRSALLVSQIGFSMLLLIVAGLFGRALLHARELDAGFDARGVHTVALDFELPRYDERRAAAVAGQLLEQSRALPQVSSVAFTANLPLSGGGMGLGGIEVDGRPAPDERRGWDEDWNVVTPAYFETLRIPIVRGRSFTDADRAGAAGVAILNETFARNLFPDQDPLGRTIKNDDRTLTIVGVARDSKYRTLGEDRRNFIYVAFAQRYVPRMTLLVRGEPQAPLAAPLRRVIAQIDVNLPIISQRTLEENAALALFPQRVALWVAGSLGVVALLLALLGIYGVTAFSVAQRTREIGVRMALGAQRGNVLGVVLRQGAVLAGAGVLLGAGAALGVTRLLTSLLYGVPATDVVAFGGAAVLLGAAALAASWIPARRAASLDPVVALRAD